jgi:hypothetical protein
MTRLVTLARAKLPVLLGARIGIIAVLYTWALLVPGGALSVDGSRWVSSRPGFLVTTARLSSNNADIPTLGGMKSGRA